jgi:hypothetical protein
MQQALQAAEMHSAPSHPEIFCFYTTAFYRHIVMVIFPSPSAYCNTTSDKHTHTHTRTLVLCLRYEASI